MRERPVDGRGKSFGQGRGTAEIVAALEHEVTVAHADFVAGMEGAWPLDPRAVDVRPVLGRGVVDFAALVDVHEQSAVAARHVTIFDDDIVFRGPADGVDPDFERVDAVAVGQPAGAVGCGRRGDVVLGVRRTSMFLVADGAEGMITLGL
jgi:hypothetical protein